jgi:hypothetical protein
LRQVISRHDSLVVQDSSPIVYLQEREIQLL